MRSIVMDLLETEGLYTRLIFRLFDDSVPPTITCAWGLTLVSVSAQPEHVLWDGLSYECGASDINPTGRVSQGELSGGLVFEPWEAWHPLTCVGTPVCVAAALYDGGRRGVTRALRAPAHPAPAHGMGMCTQHDATRNKSQHNTTHNELLRCGLVCMTEC